MLQLIQYFLQSKNGVLESGKKKKVKITTFWNNFTLSLFSVASDFFLSSILS